MTDTDHEDRRLRTTWRLAALGPLLGVPAMIALALAGTGGAAGLAVLLVLSSASCLVAAFVTAALGMLDEWRRRPVGRRRVLSAAGLFVGGGALLVMSIGAASAV